MMMMMMMMIMVMIMMMTMMVMATVFDNIKNYTNGNRSNEDYDGSINNFYDGFDD